MCALHPPPEYVKEQTVPSLSLPNLTQSFSWSLCYLETTRGREFCKTCFYLSYIETKWIHQWGVSLCTERRNFYFELPRKRITLGGSLARQSCSKQQPTISAPQTGNSLSLAYTKSIIDLSNSAVQPSARRLLRDLDAFALWIHHINTRPHDCYNREE